MDVETLGTDSLDHTVRSEASPAREKVGQEQIHNLLFGDQLSWQALIYDLINSEQLNPWDIDLSVLAQRYLERVRALEEANFFVSSKVLLAAALLLRMKSELLLEHDLADLDALLFGRKEEKKYVQERIELEDEIPGLVPRTPLPRFRKVTLHELMTALGKALSTETRRIKRVVVARQQELETGLSLPRKRVNLKDQIHTVYTNLRKHFAQRQTKLAFSELSGVTNEERIATFIPLLHLDTQRKVWIEQGGHLEEIWVWLQHLYEKENARELAMMEKEVAEAMKEFNDELPAELAEEYEVVENDFGTTINRALSSDEEE